MRKKLNVLENCFSSLCFSLLRTFADKSVNVFPREVTAIARLLARGGRGINMKVWINVKDANVENDT